NAEVSFHTGAAETLGKLSLLDQDELQPGDEAWVQVRLQDEVALARGDLFVLRLPSPSMTIGGGSIVEPHARRHRRRQATVLQQLEVLAQGTPDEIVLERLRAREPTDVESLVQRTGLGADPGLLVRELQTRKAHGLAAEDGPFVRLASHSVQFSAAQERQVAQIVEVLREAGVSPPDRPELEAELGVSPELLDAL